MSAFEPQVHKLFHNEYLSPWDSFLSPFVGLLIHSIINGLHVSGILNLHFVLKAEKATEMLSQWLF